MDIVNFPGIIAEHGLLSSAQVDLAKDLILIGKKMGSQRDGTQYENMAISVLDLVALASGGAQTLAQTLALGNITGGLNVVFSGGSQAVFNSGAFSGGLTTLALTGNQTWSLPNQSGTIALLSDIPGPDLTLYNGDGTIGTNRIATLTDNLQFASTSGGINILHGIGADPLGFGEGGILSYVTMTPAANVEAYGGVRIISGEPTWCHQVYDAINNNEAGTYVGWSTAQSNPYSAIYYYNATTDDYFGFEANAFGEQLYSQRTALVTTTLTAADRVLFVSNAGGYLKATTYADLAAQLPINTFYTGNGSTVGARTVTLGGALQFNHGALGVNGYVQMLTGGYFRNNGANPNNYFEFNHNTNIFTVNTTTASVSGFTAANNAANLRAEVTSGGYAGLTISGSTVELGFYVNGGVKYAGGILGGSAAFNGSWGFGVSPTASAKVHIVSENGQGNGTIIQSMNLSPSETILQVRDAANFTRFGVTATGVTLCDYRFVVGTSLGSVSNTSTLLVKGADSSALTPNFAITDGSNNLLIQSNNAGQFGINTTDFSSGLGGITHKFAVRANGGDYGNHTLSLFENNLNPTSNNANYQRASTSIVTKYGAFNTYNMVGSYSAADIQGGGTIGEVYGQQNAVLVRGAAVVTDVAGIFADKQVQLGTITNLASIIAHTTGLSGGTITNMMGLWVRTPVNVIGGTRTNTYGVLIEPNAVGTNNYGVIVSGNQSNGLGTLTPSNQALLELVSTDKAFLIMRMTAAQASAITPANGMMLYVTNTNGTFTVVGFWGYEAGAWVKL